MENFEEINFIDLSKRLKNKGCLIDSSSIIYLDRISLISILVQNYKIKTIDEINIEVRSNNDKQLNDVAVLNKIEMVKKNFDENFYSFLHTKFINIAPNQLSKISEADKDLVFSSIYYDLSIFTDDKIISKICYQTKRPYYNSLIAILLLLFDNLITTDNAIQSFYKINKFGRYSSKIFNFAFNLLEKIVKSKNI